MSVKSVPVALAHIYLRRHTICSHGSRQCSGYSTARNSVTRVDLCSSGSRSVAYYTQNGLFRRCVGDDIASTARGYPESRIRKEDTSLYAAANPLEERRQPRSCRSKWRSVGEKRQDPKDDKKQGGNDEPPSHSGLGALFRVGLEPAAGQSKTGKCSLF